MARVLRSLRVLRGLVTGVAAVVALGVSAACGLPDADEVVAQMRLRAEEEGLADRLRYSAVSVGGLGTAPWVSAEEWDSTPEEFRRVTALLRESQELARQEKYSGVRTNVRVRLDGTLLELRAVPTPAVEEVLLALPAPGVTMVKYDRNRLGVSGGPEIRGQVADLAPQIGDALPDGVLSLSAGGWGQVHLHRGDGSFTRELVLSTVEAVDRVQAAAGELTLREARVRDGRLEVTLGLPEGRTFGTDDAQLFRAPAEAAPPGTLLAVWVDEEISTITAVAGGTSPGPAGSPEEAALREVVEKW